MIGGDEGDRTLDLRIANATLSQLSYRPTAKHPAKSRSSQTASECPAIKMRDFAAATDNRDFAGTPGRRAILASRSGRSNEVLTLRLRMQL